MLTGQNRQLGAGGKLEIQAVGLRQAYPAALLLGLSRTELGQLPLPIELGAVGAPGNHLYVRPDVVVPMSLKLRGGLYEGEVVRQLPPALAQLYRIYAQALFFDSASNALGIVASNGVEVRVPLDRDQARARAIVGNSATATTGVDLISGAYTSPVVRIEGTIR